MKIVVVGGGSSGWMTASMLSRLIGKQHEITLVESEEVGTVGVGEATIPPIAYFNKVLGINEAEFVNATKGTFKLGIEFDGWRDAEHSYMHAFGRVGKDMGMAGFHHTWLRGKSLGLNTDFWDYSLNYQAAKNNKFGFLQKIPNTQLPGLVHAYHFDAGLYAAYLRQLSEKMGCIRVEGFIDKVNLEPISGNILSLSLKSGKVIEGDFFIDCSGFKALLIEGALKTGYEDWRHWLPCDSAMAMPCESVTPIKPFTKSIAHRAGWQWRIPLQHRTGNGVVYSSEFMSDDEASAHLMNNVDGRALGEPRPIKFTTGRRVKQWHKNCVAIGLSSGFLEPLESTSLHLVQSAIVRLVKLFPQQEINQANVDEYNRQSQIEFERIRDFIILHYKLNNRTEPFWQRMKAMEIPDTLQQKMTLFKETGSIFREQDELFTEAAWQQVMIGQGIEPKSYHTLADSLSDEQASELLQNLSAIMQGTAAKLPSHNDFLSAFKP
ncbi:tryptophan halogenase family protein [Brumicola blandensis]|uniref:Tryptophan halogenase family protein n=1 Tax=Brumicola blandensis TaxID=3075611 RepID=A0AAW8QXA3_9ALTE|nr:tryptophan halogenase family protein [Alteromonas sp. W409]MDT0581726.1 tryptophan halogenase family protein [Alteromonas sp. W409]